MIGAIHGTITMSLCILSLFNDFCSSVLDYLEAASIVKAGTRTKRSENQR